MKLKRNWSKTVLLFTVYVLFMSFFITEEHSIFKKLLIQNFHSLSIYTPF